MNIHQKWTVREAFFATVAIAFVLFLHGAIPFLMVPTLGQAVWTTGFAQSFANGPWYSIYAHDFGIPKPAAIAFGLAGAWPASLLIRFGLHPADAYAGMVAIWLVVAFIAAYRIGRKFGATRPTALLGSVAWMSMPIIWAQAGYSMLSLGTGLLSFYFLVALNLYLVETGANKVILSSSIYYFLAVIISVFMDGYTFMMFATGSSILFAFIFISRPKIRSILLRISLPVHVVSFLIAYVLYSAYIGKSQFETFPINFLRGFGLDLSFIAIPTKGVHWLPDLLSMSLERTNETYFGNASVWTTTFSLPIIIFGLFAWWKRGRHFTITTSVLLVASIGFYMALGPSVKINAKKPESLKMTHPRWQSEMMPVEMSVMPTGNSWISENLPGFSAMRAPFRWSALGVFGLWLLIIISFSKEKKDHRLLQFILFIVIIMNIPDLVKWWRNGTVDRTLFMEIDREMVSELRQNVRKNEVVAFIPWDNDFIATYLAPRTGFRTYNIGGDKNLLDAQKEWPSTLLALGSYVDASKNSIVIKMFLDGVVDVVIVPYIQKIWPPHRWPCLEVMSPTTFYEQRRVTGFVCPPQWKVESQPVVDTLQSSPYVEVTNSNLFSIIRLRPEFSESKNRESLKSTLLAGFHYPIILNSQLKDSPFILSKGWHSLEAHHVWSQAESRLTLPVPKECDSRQCYAVLKFVVFGAGKDRPVTVNFHSEETAGGWSEKIVSTSVENNEFAVPLGGTPRIQETSISVPVATSPQALTGSPDGRVLGIGLQRIDLVYK